ncbi:neutral zinc metallopeptidase [Haloechinothrix alba]|nr:neutral zinc metallopeptidase [Haloechinothrix alba]
MTTRHRPVRRRTALLAMASTVALVISACGDGPTPGRAVTEGDIGGLPVSHFDSGLADTAPDPTIEVDNVTGGPIDTVASSAAQDVERYWHASLPDQFGTTFEPVERLVSYDSGADDFRICGASVQGLVNAFYCPGEDTVGWDRGALFPLLDDQFGPIGVLTVLAHEYGHVVQHRLGELAGISAVTPTIVKELQADCFTGNYFRRVAEGGSEFFEVSTSEGINQALSALHFVRDAPGDLRHDIDAHGTAFDRTYAFQVGFEQDPGACVEIDEQAVDERTTQYTFSDQDTREGDLPLTEDTVELALDSLDAAFGDIVAERPEVLTGSGGTCPDGTGTPPMSYCPGDGTDASGTVDAAIAIDIDELATLAEPIDQRAEWEGREVEGYGDFAVFAALASRYAMGVQQAADVPLDELGAGLRAACYVGAWANFANEPRARDRILRLSPGDLDEAILEMLRQDSLIASTVDGIPVPGGFARVEALRTGFVDGRQGCRDTAG